MWQNLGFSADDYFALSGSKIIEVSQGIVTVIESASIAANLSNQTSMFAVRAVSAASNIASLNGSNLSLLTSASPAYSNPGGGNPFYVNADTNSAQHPRSLGTEFAIFKEKISIFQKYFCTKNSI